MPSHPSHERSEELLSDEGKNLFLVTLSATNTRQVNLTAGALMELVLIKSLANLKKKIILVYFFPAILEQGTHND